MRLMIRGATRQWISNWCGAVQEAYARDVVAKVAAAKTAKMAAIVKATADKEAAMCRCMRIVAEFQWKGPSGYIGFDRGSMYVAAWYHKYMTDWYTKDGYGCHWGTPPKGMRL